MGAEYIPLGIPFLFLDGNLSLISSIIIGAGLIGTILLILKIFDML
jgi:hypothetical protein